MKKFLIVLIILIILGGTVFFLGWAQLTVPPGSYGVMRSKTHGLEEEVITEGKFRWFWYKVLPTNATVSVFNLNPVRHSIRSSGTLSSGQIYANLAGLEADFSWEISGEISFSLRPEQLPALTVRENIYDDAGLRQAMESLAVRIENAVLQRLRNYTDNDYERKMEAITLNGALPELDSEISALFPEIEDFSCTLRVVRYPDYTLYEAVKKLYQEYLSRQSLAIRQDVIKEAENRIDIRIRLDELSRYGELLSKYPILLQYLALEKGIQPAGDW